MKPLKRSVALFTIVLGSLIVVYSQDNTKPMEMTGWICNSTCVNPSAGHATCDASCTDKSGDAVFVDDQGKVSKISNQDMVKGKMGQKVKVKCNKKEDESMEILQVIQANAGL